MNYKNFDLHMDFSDSSMYSTNRHWEMRIPFQNGGNLLSDMHEDRWHREDPFDLNSPWVSGGNPALRYNTSQHSNYNRNSDWWLTNVSYLRLRTFEIGYTMPASMLEWLNMRTARVYLKIGRASCRDGLQLYRREAVEERTGSRAVRQA